MNTTPPPGGPAMSMPPAAEPLFGEQMAGNLGLKCCPCTDNSLTKGKPGLDDIPPAFTMAPSVQTFTIGGNDVMAPCVIPLCVDCRRKQLGVVSKTGLIVR